MSEAISYSESNTKKQHFLWGSSYSSISCSNAPPPSSANAKSSAPEPKSSHQSLTAATKEGVPTKVKTIPLASDTEEELLKLLQQAPSSVPVLRFEWVYFIDSQGVVERDRLVFDEVRRKRHIPIFMVTSGGYQVIL